MTKKFNLYIGKAGHLAMMGEFLMRGWNVAIPEVDIGDDIFVVQGSNGALRRVQVKTATAKHQRSGINAQFSIPKAQLFKIASPPIHYVFITRYNDGWTKPIIISQPILKDYVENQQVGTQNKNHIIIYFAYKDLEKGIVNCSKLDFSRHLSDYSEFPTIAH